MTYLTETILEQFPMKHSDFIMRAYFDKQIDFSEEYKTIIEQAEVERMGANVILVDGKGPEVPQQPKVSYNKKWFGGLFAIATLIYLKWGK